MSQVESGREVDILYLTHSCPYPPQSGDRIRSYNILKYLSGRYRVHLVYPSFSSEDEIHAAKLAKYCASVQTVRMNPFLSKLRCLLGLFSRSPLTLSHFYSRRINTIVGKIAFDLVLVDCSSMAQYVMNCDKPKIIDFVDVDHDKWILYAEHVSFPKSLIYIMEYIKLKRFEYRVGSLFNHSIVVSENEKKLLPFAQKVSVVPNGIDALVAEGKRRVKSNYIIFSGVMNYFPNVDGVQYFCHDILHLIKRENEKVKFVVAGMHPDQQIQTLAADDVIITGYVSDMNSYIAHASVSVVPLRIAKGIQNKILEAMMLEVPVVATPVANQGIQAHHNEEILIAEDEADFAYLTNAVLNDEDLRKKITANAKRFVMENFRWEAHLSKLDEIILTCLSDGSKTG